MPPNEIEIQNALIQALLPINFILNSTNFKSLSVITQLIEEWIKSLVF